MEIIQSEETWLAQEKETFDRNGYRLKKHILAWQWSTLLLVDRKTENMRLLKNMDAGCPRDQDQDDNKSDFTYIKSISAFNSLILTLL